MPTLKAPSSRRQGARLLVPPRGPLHRGSTLVPGPRFGSSAIFLRYAGRVLNVDVDTDRLREVCERYGVASLEVFGSVARNEDRQDSDVDLLYVLKPDARLGFRLFDLEDELAALFGRPVDLIARKAINKYIREQVLADAQPLYAA